MHSNQKYIMATFNPKARYKWDKDATFEFSGEEFSLIRNLVQAVLQADEVKRVVVSVELNSRLQKLLEASVESGVVYEDLEHKLMLENHPLANGSLIK